MPEAATLTAPETSTQTATVSPELSKAAEGGASKLASMFEGIGKPLETTEQPPATKTATETKPAEQAKPVETEKKVEAEKKPTEPNWEKAPPKLYKAYEQLKTESAKEKHALEAKIKELSEKKPETVPDTKLVDEYQKQISELKQQLAEASYERSDEYKAAQKSWETRWNSAYKGALQDFTQLSITNSNGESRRATEDDFKSLVNMPWPQVKELMKEDAPAFLALKRSLNQIQEEANHDLNSKLTSAKQGHELKSREQQAFEQKQKDIYDNSYKSAVAEIEATIPDLVKAPEGDTEAAAALQKGYSFAREVLNKGASMSPEDRAAHIAALEANVAGFRMRDLQYRRAQEEIKNLKAELAKFQKTDPGTVQGAPKGTSTQVEEDFMAPWKKLDGKVFSAV